MGGQTIVIEPRQQEREIAEGENETALHRIRTSRLMILRENMMVLEKRPDWTTITADKRSLTGF